MTDEASQPVTSHILSEHADGIAVLTLNHPERLNALDHGPGSMHEELVELVEAYGKDDAVRCIVVRGAGRAFSSGGFLPPGSGNAASPSSYYEFLSGEDELNRRLRNACKPIFAAVHGMCLGSALMMALHFDFIVAAESTRLGFIETRFGSTGVEMLAYFVGPQWAKFLSLSGELIDARRAGAIGLILEAVPDKQFDLKVADLARRIAAMPTPATIHNRRLANAALDAMGWTTQKETARALNSVTNSTVGKTVDGRSFHDIRASEGMDAFKAARDAPFREPWLDDPVQTG